MKWDVFRCLWALVKWLVLGVAIGALVGAIGGLFGHTLIWVNAIRKAYPFVVYGLPLGGLVIVALYRGAKNTDDKGTNTVIGALQDGTDIPFKMAPLIFISTTITQLFGGSAGREGAALQMGGSAASLIGKLFRLKKEDRTVLIMSGMSAVFAGLFGTPLTACLFTMEFESIGTIFSPAFLPCFLSALVASKLSSFLGIHAEISIQERSRRQWYCSCR